MSEFDPPPSWYEPDDDDEHVCRGVWCLDDAHKTWEADDDV
jgi:hypothetical protein